MFVHLYISRIYTEVCLRHLWWKISTWIRGEGKSGERERKEKKREEKKRKEKKRKEKQGEVRWGDGEGKPDLKEKHWKDLVQVHSTEKESHNSHIKTHSSQNTSSPRVLPHQAIGGWERNREVWAHSWNLAHPQRGSKKKTQIEDVKIIHFFTSFLVHVPYYSAHLPDSTRPIRKIYLLPRTQIDWAREIERERERDHWILLCKQ